MDSLIQFIGIGILIQFWIFWFKPIQWLKRKYIVKPLLHQHCFWFIDNIWCHLNCSKCLGFWIGLIVYQNIYLGAIMSVYSYILNLALYDNRTSN
jgi:hypothetical protein